MNDQVREYWEEKPCGIDPQKLKNQQEGSREWYDAIEEERYRYEPFIHSVAQFSRHVGKKILEIGVGAGTDHLQWARAGAVCYGVDLTDTAIAITRKRLSLYGLSSNLQRIDAETLPFEDNTFDIVYSWGVIHHSEYPEKILQEIFRILKPDGQFIGMMYGRHSPAVLKKWVKYALLKGKPWRSFSNVVYYNVESVGTKAYTKGELLSMFSDFHNVELIPIKTNSDIAKFPKCLSMFFPDEWGWYIGIKAKK